MTPRVLLVNPPIYDFTAYDFWMKPYGLLRVAGSLRGRADMKLFDFLDRAALPASIRASLHDDEYGRGRFPSQELRTPSVLEGIHRRYKRFGLPQEAFRDFLAREGPFDFVLVQTGMTYWYHGVIEVINAVRESTPGAKIVLGGVYATLCPVHAQNLGADLVVGGADMTALWELLGTAGDTRRPPLWEAYPRLETGVIKLTDGCPFHCTYCCVPRVHPGFSARPLSQSIEEIALLAARGAHDVAFYDDALLYRAEEILLPFLDEVIRQRIAVRFHTPNALHARFITPEIARKLVGAGFKTFYLGFESRSLGWHERTGSKVAAAELAQAADHLAAAGAARGDITAYLLIAHPDGEAQDLDGSMRFAHSLGVRLMLAEFSPIPGTPDGEACRGAADLDEPLTHNKTWHAIRTLGFDEVSRLKDLCRELNRAL